MPQARGNGKGGGLSALAKAADQGMARRMEVQTECAAPPSQRIRLPVT